jgi:hypothetical protein
MAKVTKGFQVAINQHNAVQFTDLTKTIRAVKVRVESPDQAIWIVEKDDEYIAPAETVFMDRKSCHDKTESELRTAREYALLELDQCLTKYKEVLGKIDDIDSLIADCDGATVKDKEIASRPMVRGDWNDFDSRLKTLNIKHKKLNGTLSNFDL